MAYIIALAALTLLSVAATVWLIRTDGYRPVPTDPERVARRREPSPTSRRERSRADFPSAAAAPAGDPAPARKTTATAALRPAGAAPTAGRRASERRLSDATSPKPAPADAAARAAHPDDETAASDAPASTPRTLVGHTAE